MQPSPRYRLEVAPLTAISIRRSPLFSYAAEEAVARGSLVSISFGRRSLKGIVFSSQPLLGKVPLWMKFIKKIDEEGALGEAQLKLALFLAETTLTPLGNCLKHFVVPSQKRVTVAKSHKKTVFTPLPLLNSEEAKTLGRLTKKSIRPRAFSSHTFQAARNILFSFLSQKISEKKQVLFLVPEFFLTEWWYQELQSFFPEEMLALIHSKVKGSDLSRAWQRIRTGEALIVLGTRQALFASFHNLESVLITDEEDETSYKQWEMSPRYRVKEVASELSRLHKSALILTSPTLSLGTFLAEKNKTLALIQPKSNLSKRAPLVLANMRFEKKKRGRAVLSQGLIDHMRVAFTRHEQVFLVGKQQGLSSFSVCKNCRAVLRCPQCEKALTGGKAGHFFCLGCGYTTDIFPTCRSCQHMVFESYGAGTDKIEREVRFFFPHVRILKIDRESIKTRLALERAVRDIRTGHFDVLIGTHALIKVPNLPKTSLIAMIEADSLTAFPDYQAEEKLTRDIERIRLLAGSHQGGIVLLQTFEPERPIFSVWPNQSFEKTAEDLLTEREAFRYPPVARFLRIECLGKTLPASKKIAQTVEGALAALIEKEHLKADIIPHHLPLSVARRTHYQLFFRLETTAPLPSALHALLIRFSGDIHIDIDPLTLT